MGDQFTYTDSNGKVWYLFSKVVELKGQGGTREIYFFSTDPNKLDKEGKPYIPSAKPDGLEVKAGRMPTLYDPTKPPKPPKKRKIKK